MQTVRSGCPRRAFRRYVHNVLGSPNINFGSGGFNHVWHHADFAHDIRQMHTVTSGQTNKGAVDATSFLFRIQLEYSEVVVIIAAIRCPAH